jgi:hypothetical protein
MAYAIEMGSDAIMYLPSFIKIGSAFEMLVLGGGTQTYKQHGDCISLSLFFKINKIC